VRNNIPAGTANGQQTARLMDAEKRRRLEQGEHPYADNPAFPAGEHAQQAAMGRYSELMEKLARALNMPVGRVAQAARQPQSLVGLLMQSAGQAMQFEQAHRRELEEAAVNLVLEMPQFQDAREAYEADELRIRATLANQIDVSDIAVSAEAEPSDYPEAELQVAEIAQELEAEKKKRRFINMMTQGAAVNQNFAYEQVADFLNRLNPQLLPAYSIAMPAAEMLYHALPEQFHNELYAAGAGAAGRVKLNYEGDIPVIEAQALIFPVLVQELVKGLMEYASMSESDETDEQTQRHVIGQTDTLENETWDILMGPGVWQRIEQTLGPENARYQAYLHRHLAMLPTSEFNRIVPEIVQGTQQGRRYVEGLVRRWSAGQQG
jgi:hypothetical protein